MATYRQPPVKVRGILVTHLNPVKPCCWPNEAREQRNDTFGGAASGMERHASNGDGSRVPQGQKRAKPRSERGLRRARDRDKRRRPAAAVTRIRPRKRGRTGRPLFAGRPWPSSDLLAGGLFRGPGLSPFLPLGHTVA